MTFAKTKRRRLLIPALFTFFVLSPLNLVVAGHLIYWPHAGVAWFLFWLMLFQIVYASFRYCRESSNPNSDTESDEEAPVTEDNTTETERTPGNESGRESTDAAATTTTTDSAPAEGKAKPSVLSSMLWRKFYGAVVCGLLLIPFRMLEIWSFASMPITIGSLTCDFFMFYLGPRASHNRWFEHPTMPLVDVLGVRLWLLSLEVFVEGAIIDILFFSDRELWWVPGFVVAGMYCLDMSLLVLVIFEKWMNFETKFTRFLYQGAYGVYLLHSIVIVGTTRIYMLVCDHYEYYDNGHGDGEEDGEEGSDEPHYNFPVGFAVVTLVTLVTVWPLAYFLKQLPYLKTIL